jgi:hypothetical protein
MNPTRWVYFASGDGRMMSAMKTNDDSFFAEPTDPRVEARELALEVICRLLVWMADGSTLADRGLRASVALYCVRPDLINGATLEQIGDMAGCTRQAVHKLAKNFRLTTGLDS